MKALTVAVLAGSMLVAGVAYAQQAPPPAQQTTPPAGQKPPAVPPAAAPQAAPAPVVFPEGAKYAFINIQRIASESAEGKTSSSRIEALRAKKAAELSEKNKTIEALQAKKNIRVLECPPLHRGGNFISAALTGKSLYNGGNLFTTLSVYPCFSYGTNSDNPPPDLTPLHHG